MELKYGTDGWSQWITHNCAPKAPSFVKVGMYAGFIKRSGKYQEGSVTQIDKWQSVVKFPLRQPKGLALLKESMYKLNITGDTEQKLLENT